MYMHINVYITSKISFNIVSLSIKMILGSNQILCVSILTYLLLMEMNWGMISYFSFIYSISSGLPNYSIPILFFNISYFKSHSWKLLHASLFYTITIFYNIIIYNSIYSIILLLTNYLYLSVERVWEDGSVSAWLPQVWYLSSNS